jgi:hypothetical protein
MYGKSAAHANAMGTSWDHEFRDDFQALLKLARKTAQAGLFRIMLPEAWVKAPAAPAALE